MKALNRFKRFLKDNDGMEFLQIAIIVVVVVFIATAVWALGRAISDKINEAASQVGGVLDAGGAGGGK